MIISNLSLKEDLENYINSTKKYIENANHRIESVKKDILEGKSESLLEDIEFIKTNAILLGKLQAELKDLEEEYQEVINNAK